MNQPYSCTTDLTSQRLTPRQAAWLLCGVSPLLLIPLWMAAIAGWGPSSAKENVACSGAGIVLLGMLGVCVTTDVAWRKIPNWATLTGLAWAWLLAGFGGLFASESPRPAGVPLADSLWGSLACFGIMLMIYSLAGGGAGDVKLMAAIGAFLGVRLGLQAMMWSYLVAATAVVAWGIWRVGLLRLIRAFLRQCGSVVLPLWVRPPDKQDREMLHRPMPLAPAFAIGTVVVLIVGDLIA